ncbi:MAG: HPP family protein, partial [Burkholderiales bacterium]|nr:HPP family protein [Burkholderiales bacterium]
MFATPAPWLRRFQPARASVSQRERLRAAVGALIGIGATGALSAGLLGLPLASAWLIAPMGASAVLLFGVPASPLAQPWSILGGNLVAALVGVSCARHIAEPVWAAAAAIALAITAMFALRCLHPPSGAVALTAVLGGPAVHAAGYGFVVTPVALNTLLLLAAALLYNNLTGRRYPHSQQADSPHPHQTADPVPTSRLGFSAEDLQAALKQYDQVLDISVDDLQALFHETEAQAFRRRFGQTRCAEVMSRDVVTVEFATELAEAWALMRRHAVHALPVLDRARRVIGIVTRADFLRHAELTDQGSIGPRLRTLLARTPHSHSAKPEVVGQIMTAPVRT